uniref:Si:ch211-214p16.3 n=1 Tax=Oryzias sinensis TaxID=183150 RepID=A0A8C7Y0X5_9TELE
MVVGTRNAGLRISETSGLLGFSPTTISKVYREWNIQLATSNLVYGGRYDGREDFAVVVQPFFRNSILPLTADGKPDTTYFSVDCFHFSERGQADMASAVWNNMLEPVDEKQTYNNFRNNRSNIKCPTEVRRWETFALTVGSVR